MKTKTIATVARLELLVTVRNKWTLIFAIVFGALVVSISYFGIMAEGFSGMQNFTRTSASILNLVLYIVPLVALTMGTLSFTGDKGSAELLYSQPISRSEITFGKVLGIFASIAISTLVGYTIAGGIIFFSNGTDGVASYALFVLLSLMLSLIFLSLSVLIATISKRKSRAFGVALFVWFFFVLFYDLLALGGTLFLKGSASNMFLFFSLFGNPVGMVRVASLIILDNASIFGPAGATLIRFLGGGATSVLILTCALFLWIILPITFARRILRHQDI